MFIIYAFGSRTERSGERLPKAARGSIEARNAAVEQLLGTQIDLRDLVVAVAERGKFSAFCSQLQFCSHHGFTQVEHLAVESQITLVINLENTMQSAVFIRFYCVGVFSFAGYVDIRRTTHIDRLVRSDLVVLYAPFLKVLIRFACRRPPTHRCHSEWSEAESNCVAAPKAESKRLYAQDDLLKKQLTFNVTRHIKFWRIK